MPIEMDSVGLIYTLIFSGHTGQSVMGACEWQAVI